MWYWELWNNNATCNGSVSTWWEMHVAHCMSQHLPIIKWVTTASIIYITMPLHICFFISFLFVPARMTQIALTIFSCFRLQNFCNTSQVISSEPFRGISFFKGSCLMCETCFELVIFWFCYTICHPYAQHLTFACFIILFIRQYNFWRLYLHKSINALIQSITTYL